MQAQKEKGLCLFCYDKFSLGHRCKKPQLFLLEVEEKEENEEGIEEESESLEISIHALSGMASPRTMGVEGLVKHQPVSILIDGGGTHNFTDQHLA